MTHAEKVAEAQRLRAEGLLLREIAERMDAKLKTVSNWLCDPDGSRLRARKDTYRGECKNCGAPTTGCNGADQAPEHCRDCWATAHAKWTPETVVAAIQCFAERYARPPAAVDFNPPHALTLGHDWRAERFHSDGDYPYANSVLYVFGSWNAGLAAAGFPIRAAGGYPRTGSAEQRGAHLEDERLAA